MPSPQPEPIPEARQSLPQEISKWILSNWMLVAAVVISTALITWFFGGEVRYGPHREDSAFRWLYYAWNPETDYEHGILFPFLIAGLIIYRARDLKAAAGEVDYRGLLVVLAGVLFYVAGYRTLQPRVTVGALPFIVWGSIFYLWGWRVAKITAFPVFFFLLAIPLPNFQQATTQLQLLATSLAHHGSSLFGVETTVRGTEILPVHGVWEPLKIAAGCSGIRSLMALLMISASWAYVAKLPLWKKVVLFMMAFPLAIFGNALRVISIFVIAEYGNEAWAKGTWHDWSGLLLFYPFSLFLLLTTHSLLEGGLPWKKDGKRQLRRVVVSQDNEPKSFLPET